MFCGCTKVLYMNNLKNLYERYLNLIGIETTPTGFDGLTEIVRNHLSFIPFENVSKLLLFDREKAGRPIALSEFLDNIEFLDLGGTCYSSNPFLRDLLFFLGYKANLLGANMDQPNVHTCIRTGLNSHQYHIDVGYAAPFKKPIRLDNIPYEIKHGNYTYLLKKIKNVNKYGIEVLLDGEKIHGYIINEVHRNFDFFSNTIIDSFKPGNTFMSCIRITRFFEDRSVELKNRTLTIYNGKESYSKILRNIEEIETAVKNDLMMPKCPIQKAIKILEEVTQKSFFEDEDYPEEY